VLCLIFFYNCPKIGDFPKIFRRSFENVDPELWTSDIEAPVIEPRDCLRSDACVDVS